MQKASITRGRPNTSCPSRCVATGAGVLQMVLARGCRREREGVLLGEWARTAVWSRIPGSSVEHH